MNYAHAHLILNHLPVVGVPMAVCILAYGVLGRNLGAQKFALAALVGVAAIAVLTFFTGEPAEKLVEHLPGVSESFIEAHEDAAMMSVVLTALTGVIALGILWLSRRQQIRRTAVFVALGVAFLSAVSLGYTANLGGKIRHTEIRAAPHIQIKE